MKKLCFGALFKVLCFAKGKGTNQDVIFKNLFSPFFNNDYEFDYDPGTVSNAKSGTNLSATIIPAVTGCTNFESVANYYKTSLLPLLNRTKHPNIILAMKDIINSDTTIPNTTQIGFDSNDTKQAILSGDRFVLPYFLAGLIAFVVNIDNINCTEITKPFFDSFDANAGSVIFDERPLLVSTEFSPTAYINKFNNTFTRVDHSSLSLPNPSVIEVYQLHIQNNEFSFDSINDFIKSNIGRYVFSRAKRNEYIQNDNLETLCLDAVKELNRYDDKSNSFSEIMLYSFLECALHAPKIMSKIELQNNGGRYQSLSSGIHLLPAQNIRATNNQLVFGSSKIINSLNNAIDEAFNQIVNIRVSHADEYRLVESTVFNNTFDSSTSNYLHSILVPTKNTVPRPDTAFGVFLGYSIQVNNKESLSNDAYREAVASQMSNDIISSIPYIINKITTLGFTNFSFYFYVLPLDEAENNSDSIISELSEEI